MSGKRITIVLLGLAILIVYSFISPTFWDTAKRFLDVSVISIFVMMLWYALKPYDWTGKDDQ